MVGQIARRLPVRRQLLVGLLALATALSASAGEPWADSHLPKDAQAGLQLWLDASRQTAAAGRDIAPDAALEIWRDGSGHGRHFTQKEKDRQPRFQIYSNGRTVRFDGARSFLSLAGPQLEFAN